MVEPCRAAAVEHALVDVVARPAPARPRPRSTLCPPQIGSASCSTIGAIRATLPVPPGRGRRARGRVVNKATALDLVLHASPAGIGSCGEQLEPAAALPVFYRGDW